MGRSNLFLRLEIIKKFFGTVALIISMFISVEAMAYSMLFVSVFSQIVNSWPNKFLLNYSYSDQLKDMLPQIGLSLIMGGIVYCITLLKFSNWVTLFLQIASGAFVYIVLSRSFRVDSYTYILEIIKRFIVQRKNTR